VGGWVKEANHFRWLEKEEKEEEEEEEEEKEEEEEEEAKARRAPGYNGEGPPIGAPDS
jgi:hypothetical protein